MSEDKIEWNPHKIGCMFHHFGEMVLHKVVGGTFINFIR